MITLNEEQLKEITAAIEPEVNKRLAGIIDAQLEKAINDYHVVGGIRALINAAIKDQVAVVITKVLAEASDIETKVRDLMTKRIEYQLTRELKALKKEGA